MASKFGKLYFTIASAAVLLLVAFAAHAARDFDDSVETALNIYHAASRQAEAAVAVVRTKQYELSTSDKAYETAFATAVWEGIKLANPSATAEQRLKLASAIDVGRSFASTSKGAAMADYDWTGEGLDASQTFSIELDADEAFKLGYAQATKRGKRLAEAKP